MTRKFGSDELCELGINAVKVVINVITTQLKDEPNVALQSHLTTKDALAVDHFAEMIFAKKISGYNSGHYKNIEIYGEERLGKEPLDLTDCLNTCVLVDALDGSDLFERGMSNWCVAAIFFTPTNQPGKQIRCAVVGLPDQSIYYATDDEDGVWVRRGKCSGKYEKVRGLSNVTEIRNASICFYGQKILNLLATLKLPLWKKLGDAEQSAKDSKASRLKTRIYNLGGIPMIVKLLDKTCKSGRGIDAVLDVNGQQAHDIIPGAFLAKKAGATVVDLEGNELTYEQLGSLLLKPNVNLLKYVIASTNQLANEIVLNLSPN